MNAHSITVTGLTAATVVTATMLLGSPDPSGLAGFFGYLSTLAGESLFDEAAFWTLLASLFAIMNPLVAVPFFSAITEGYSKRQRNRLALNATITVAITLATAAALGDEILDFFAISIGSFRIAGGIIVLLMGLSLIRSNAGADPEPAAENARSQAICPIAIPLLAGPGAIASIIVFCNGASRTCDYVTLGAVIAVMVGIVYLTLRVAATVARFFGDLGLTVASRLLGMVVVAIAIDMATIGIGLRFPQLLG
jgi:multiple antibiotic resistance protein